jgi:enoyl-CoA hydratase/carnithine racemase
MNRPMLKLMAGALGAAVFALVLTLGGTAFAAGGDLGAVDKQAVNPSSIFHFYSYELIGIF